MNPLITTEGGTVHVKGSGLHQGVACPARHRGAVHCPSRTTRPPATRFRLRRCYASWRVRTFTIADDGTFEADLKVEALLVAYYFIDDDNFHDPTGGTKYDVRYNIHVVAEQKGQKPLTAQELWTSKNVVSTQVLEYYGEKPAPFAPRLGYNAVTDPAKSQDLKRWWPGFNGDIHSVRGVQLVVREKGSNTPVLATSDIIEFDHPTQASAYRDGNLNGTVNLPANTLDASEEVRD